MKNNPPVILLRKLRPEDEVYLASIGNNREIWNNLRNRFPHPYTVADARFFIEMVQNEDPQQTFAIEKEGKLAGIAALLIQRDVYSGSAEIGYWLGKDFWGQGIATEVVQRLMRYGFGILGLTRIYACVFEYNQASMRILEKNGFRKEGIARKAVLKNGELWDEYRYAKLSTDV